MVRRIITRQHVALQPEQVKNLVGRKPVKEGKNLPMSIEEDVGNFSLHPMYSKKQLRCIRRLQMGKIKSEKKSRMLYQKQVLQ